MFWKITQNTGAGQYTVNPAALCSIPKYLHMARKGNILGYKRRKSDFNCMSSKATSETNLRSILSLMLWTNGNALSLQEGQRSNPRFVSLSICVLGPLLIPNKTKTVLIEECLPNILEMLEKQRKGEGAAQRLGSGLCPHCTEQLLGPLTLPGTLEETQELLSLSPFSLAQPSPLCIT